MPPARRFAAIWRRSRRTSAVPGTAPGRAARTPALSRPVRPVSVRSIACRSARCTMAVAASVWSSISLKSSGSAGEGTAVAQDPVAAPAMVGQRAVLLHLVQLGGLDQGKRVLLPVDDVGLQGGVEFVEAQAGGRGAQAAEQGRHERGTGTRSFRPRRSSGPAMAAREEVIWRNPLSQCAGNRQHAGLHDRRRGPGRPARHPSQPIPGRRSAARSRCWAGPDSGTTVDRVRLGAANSSSAPSRKLRQHVRIAAELAVGEDADRQPPARVQPDRGGDIGQTGLSGWSAAYCSRS